MSEAPFVVATGHGRHVERVSTDGGSTWTADADLFPSAPGRLVVGVDTAAGEVWISTVEMLGKGISCGIPPSEEDLGSRLGWSSEAPGADIVVSLAFTDPLPRQAVRWTVAFLDGLPSLADPSEAEIELRCELFVGLRILLAGLPIREVSSRLAMAGDVLSTGVLIGAVARPEVLRGHAWLGQALGVAERTRSWWEPVVPGLLGSRSAL